jgi:hypothetical protein
MLDTRRARLLAVALLLAALFGVLVWHGTLDPDPRQGRYPDEGDLAGDAAAHVGDRVAISGTVVETDPAVVRARYTAVVDGDVERGTARYRVRDPPADLAVGQRVQVFGTLVGGRTVAPSNVTRYGDAPGYMFLVSLLAGLWVLARLVVHWRLERADLSLRRRDRPLARRGVGRFLDDPVAALRARARWARRTGPTETTEDDDA